MSDDNDIGGAFFGLGFGVWAFFNGFQVFRKKQLMDNIPTSTVRGMAMGLVELSGKARREKPLVGPLSRERCVIFAYVIERYEKNGDEGKWVTIAKGDSFTCMFNVEDETGQVRVLPFGAELIAAPDFIYTTSWQTPLTPNLEDFMRWAGIRTGGFLGKDTLRFTERNIKPGETVYVLGTAKKLRQPQEDLKSQQYNLMLRLEQLKSNPERMKAVDANKDGNISDDEWRDAVDKVERELLQDELAAGKTGEVDDVMVAKGDAEKTFIISDKSQKELDASMGWQIAGGVFGGAVIAVFCLWYLLTRFHII